MANTYYGLPNGQSGDTSGLTHHFYGAPNAQAGDASVIARNVIALVPVGTGARPTTGELYPPGAPGYAG